MSGFYMAETPGRHTSLGGAQIEPKIEGMFDGFCSTKQRYLAQTCRVIKYLGCGLVHI